MPRATLDDLRIEFHRNILREILGLRRGKESRGYSNADTSSRGSKALAELVARKLRAQTGQEPCRRLPQEQTVGTVFAKLTRDFLDQAFGRINHLRPGEWALSTSQESGGITKFYQYEHVAELAGLLQNHPKLRATLGGDYLVTPDITISRSPVTDAEINKQGLFVSEADHVARLTPLRRAVNTTNILHASVSCKWTIRSDRAQNTRTEALNLLRHRKGKVPIVVAVTFEPLPTRIASVALGTGDLDCTYHGALMELSEAVAETENEDQQDMLATLVKGRRLRDISDLPLDLAV
ncbi:MAG TPA: NgoMIV family type II restriction endonuclease [Methylomirabilota bacterium]|nr:NgoMIV family type II restriction endonuclease [Methylomirabilota bacterium]